MDLSPGFIQLHGNQQEQLCAVLVDWIKRYPLKPLEQETVLVQSNGVAQWLQVALASEPDLGISTALNLSLPGRFLWQAYRAVLGDELPVHTVFDKPALVWRIYQMLPQCTEGVYEPLNSYLDEDFQSHKRYQLALRLADLFDQYQIYRPDWLLEWEQGKDRILKGSAYHDLSESQQWQAQLWRDLCDGIQQEQRHLSRPHIHQQFLEKAQQLTAETRPAGLPRRIIIFGLSALPKQTVEVLQALSGCCQIFLTVHNPCQYYWADILDNQESLRQRQRQRSSTLEQHTQPLLASWGKQGRDYTGVLNEADQSEQFIHLFEQHKVDLFSEAAGESVLATLQNDILNLRSNEECLAEERQLSKQDNSCVFHICHSAQREVEVLHDQLLQAFAEDSSLKPRDILVMAPDINAYAPHIQAVFGQVPTSDSRYLPFIISDQSARQNNPLLDALAFLLALPDKRCTSSEVLDLLAVPALRRRFGIEEDQLTVLQQWIEESGIRWGLDAEHRASLDLPALEQNTWHFGVERLLLGYASDDAAAWQNIEPYTEVAGLDAVLAGRFIQLISRLKESRQVLSESYRLEAWRDHIHQLLERFFDLHSKQEQVLLLGIEKALNDTLQNSELAAFDEQLPVNIIAKHLLSAIDENHLSQRFFAGSINFASLLPMRAIPFKRICLLGMSDSNYPRQKVHNDFDLMRSDYRAGDRSRREDDRYLFLEALLSAREQFYISWVGRSAQDNSERPASVLVSQLRDHIAALWQDSAIRAITKEHPLQAFSTQYFSEPGQAQGFFTYAKEWQNLHQLPEEQPQATQVLPITEFEQALTIRQCYNFLKDPCAFFFNQRLQVYLEYYEEEEHEHEVFSLGALQRWSLQRELLTRLREAIEQGDSHATLSQVFDEAAKKMQGQGQLAMAGFAELQQQELAEDILQLATQYQSVYALHAAQPPMHVSYHIESEVFKQALISDVIGDLFCDKQGRWLHVILTNSYLKKDKTIHYKHFLSAWLTQLLLHDAGIQSQCLLLSPSGTVLLPTMQQSEAQALLAQLGQLIEQALLQPLPASLDIMIETLNEKSSWADQYNPESSDNNTRYLHRAFASSDQISQHPLFGQCLDLYQAFKHTIDDAVKDDA